MLRDSFGNLYMADYANNIIRNCISGLDFIGTPAFTTIPPASPTQSVMIHGAGVTGATATGPFSTGTATCSTYAAGDLEANVSFPLPTLLLNRPRDRILSAQRRLSSHLRCTGFGAGIGTSSLPLTITASSASMVFGGSVPVINFTTSADPITGGLATAPTCSTTATSAALLTYPTSCVGAVDSRFAPVSYVDGTLDR